MIIRFCLAFIVTLCLSLQSFACSCAYSDSTREIIEAGAIVVLATPVGDYSTKTYSDGSVSPTRLRIWRTYSGETSTFEDIDSSQHSSCAIRFPEKETALIVAWRGKSGVLQTGFCADGGYSKSQWLEYFKTGKNAVSWSSCVMDIKNAYEAGGIFQLKNKECVQYVEEYEAREAEYEARNNAQPVLTEQESCFQKIATNYALRKLTGFEITLENVEICEKYITEYDKIHPEERKKVEARKPVPLQPNIKVDRR
jgi:hypothetical protein